MTKGRAMDEWYIIQTNPNCEKKAVGELRRAGVRVYLPKRAERKVNKRTKAVTIRRRPAYTGYLFIRFPDHLYDMRGVPPFGLARRCQGVKEFLRAMNVVGEWEPFAIPHRIVAAIMRLQRQRNFDDEKTRQGYMARTYSKGKQMRVSDGPFTSFIATIERLNHDSSVTAFVNILGRATTVRFPNPEAELAPIGQAACEGP